MWQDILSTYNADKPGSAVGALIAAIPALAPQNCFATLRAVTPAEFKTKWAKVSAKESAAYQSHFDDLCRLLKLPPPLEADPTGEFFCFQKRVFKGVELYEMHEMPDARNAKQNYP